MSREHHNKIQALLRNLPRGVPLLPPMRRCTLCSVGVENHGFAGPTAHDLVSKNCPLPDTYLDDTPWPATFGTIHPDGRVEHRVDEGDGVCLQCGGCSHFRPVDADFGWCRCPGGQYEGQLQFEHLSCVSFSLDPHGWGWRTDEDDEDDGG